MFFVQKPTPEILKWIKAIPDDAFLYNAEKDSTNKTFACVAFAHRESEPFPHLALFYKYTSWTQPQNRDYIT